MSKKRDKSRKKTQSSVSRVLASSNRPQVVRARFFDALSAGEIRRAVPDLASHPHFKAAISLPGDNLGDFYRHHTPPASLEKNIAWCLGIVQYHAAIIQFFLDQEYCLVQFLLENQYERCLELLNDIDRCCGTSMWSIGLRGALLTAHQSSEEKRSFLTSLAERSGDNSFMKATARFVATRYEDTEFLSPEFSALEQKLKRGFAGELLHFLMHKLVPYNFSFDYNFNHIISFEKNTSPIDIYKCLHDMVCHTICAHNEDEHFDLSRNIVRQFSQSFKSASVRGLCNYYGIQAEWEFDEVEYQILDMYTKGEYLWVCEKMQSTPSLGRKFTLFEIWARSACRTNRGTDGPFEELLQSTCSVMLKDDSYDRSVTSLLMLSHAFGMMTWFKELHYLIIRETRFIQGGRNEKLALASIALSEVDSPARVRAMAPALREDFVDAMHKKMPTSVVVRLYGNSSRPSPAPKKWEAEGIDAFRAKKFLAKYYLEQGQYTLAIPLLIGLSKQSEDLLTKDEAARLLITAYLSGDLQEEAAVAYVTTVMANPHLLRTFDSKAICNACVELAKQSKSLSVPIALSLHSRFVDDEFDSALRFSFEKFLRNNNFSFPIDLIGNNDFDQNQLRYFLEHVCLPDVMKLYLLFETSKEIERHRIEICKKLIELGHSVSEMIFEVKERTRRLVVLDATQHVENSRIYADVSTFAISTEFKQLFERFATLRSKDYSSEPDEITLSGLYEKIKDEQILIDNSHTLYVQDIVLNEKNSAFLKLCKLLRDEFTFGVKGLNGHISTRIRHGHFPNTIRKCVSDEGLFSPKVSATGSYKKTVWSERFGDLPVASVASIDKSFADFSSKLESLISEANDKWFQINVFDQEMSGLESGKITGEALFNYSTTAFESYCLQKKVLLASGYTDFVKLMTQWLWDRTGRNLLVIQERINTSFREKAYRLIDSLESEIFRILDDQEKMPEFSAAIGRARLRLGTAIESILGWFTKSEGLAVAYFDSEIAITIAKLSAGANVHHSDDSGVQFQGRALSYLVDVLYVLLDNCVTKSNLPRTELEIVSRIYRDQGRTILSVVNNCSPVPDVTKSNDDLNFYRDSYGEDTFALKAAQGEGGSGLFKVWKALAKDLDLVHKMEFGYTHNDSFSVSIAIEDSELEKVMYRENIDHRR